MSVQFYEQAIIGILFGFFIHKGRAYEPRLIQDQMLFKDFTMIEMFFSAIGTSALIFGISSLIPGTWGDSVREARAAFLKRQKRRGILSVFIGAFLLGIGLGISGACPGTFYVQTGAGISGWWLIGLGGILGNFVYYILEQPVERVLYSKINVSETINDRHVFRSYSVATIVLSVLLITSSLLLYFFAPNSTSIVPHRADGNVLLTPVWPAPLCGFFVGLLQIPSIQLFSGPIGMSSALICSVAPTYPLLRSTKLAKEDSELASWTPKKIVSNLLRILFVAAGSFLSAYISGTFQEIPGLLSEPTPSKAAWQPYVLNGYIQTLLGGFLIFFGSRIAQGCTAGHGLSGFALLEINSIVAVPSIFAGGIAAAWTIKTILGV